METYILHHHHYQQQQQRAHPRLPSVSRDVCVDVWLGLAGAVTPRVRHTHRDAAPPSILLLVTPHPFLYPLLPASRMRSQPRTRATERRNQSTVNIISTADHTGGRRGRSNRAPGWVLGDKSPATGRLTDHPASARSDQTPGAEEERPSITLARLFSNFASRPTCTARAHHAARSILPAPD